MSYIDATILGLLQGLTEFLPISSSGHLVLAQSLLGVKQPGVSFEVMLHLGTMLAVVVYFRSLLTDLVRSLYTPDRRRERTILVYLVIGSLPAGVAGLLFHHFYNRVFSNPLVTSLLLLVTGVILLTPRFLRPRVKGLALPSVIVMGLAQALAILPGLSRSAATITFGELSGAEPSQAAEFSLLLAVPAIAGAALLRAGDPLYLNLVLSGQYLVGVLLAFVSGLVAVRILILTVRRGQFEYFAYYCFAAGLVGLYLFL
ncbi:MAG TPA: undecaprenyl-diphosphate phosphatase [Acidobacteriota bacterium]|nr:undecaprenyl-diphosphate phosphatase [Acidobacteriota bacterium]